MSVSLLAGQLSPTGFSQCSSSQKLSTGPEGKVKLMLLFSGISSYNPLLCIHYFSWIAECLFSFLRMSSKNKALWTPARHTHMWFVCCPFIVGSKTVLAAALLLLSCSRTQRSQSLNPLCLNVKYRQELRALFSENLHLWQVKLWVPENWNSGHNLINRGLAWGQVFILGLLPVWRAFASGQESSCSADRSNELRQCYIDY